MRVCVGVYAIGPMTANFNDAQCDQLRRRLNVVKFPRRQRLLSAAAIGGKPTNRTRSARPTVTAFSHFFRCQFLIYLLFILIFDFYLKFHPRRYVVINTFILVDPIISIVFPWRKVDATNFKKIKSVESQPSPHVLYG